ncbi:MAG: MSCRAMM family protein, partial [Pyrinomonadaceae bacterium]
MKIHRGLIVTMAVLLSLLIPCTSSSARSSSSGLTPGSTPRFNTLRSSLAATQDRTVKLTVTVKNAEGKEIPAARVNVYTRSAIGRVVPDFLKDSLPADYGEFTNAKGIATFEFKLKAGEGLRLSLEIAREDFQTIKDEAFIGKDFQGEMPKEYTLTPKTKGDDVNLINVGFNVQDDDFDFVQGAKVSVREPIMERTHEGVTGADGSVTIPVPMYPVANFHQRDFQIAASKEGYKVGRKTITLRESQIGTTVFGGNIEIEKKKSIAGRDVTITVHVIDAQSKKAVLDANVILDGAGYYSNTTDASGNATLIVKETGRFAVRISQEYYEPFAGEAQIQPGEENQTFDFTMKAKAKKFDEDPNSIEVTVLQGDRVERIARYNLPLPDASVRIEQGGSVKAGNVTDSSGRAKISGDFEGNVQVVVEASGYKRQVKTVRVAGSERLTGSSASVTFLMQPEASEDSIEVSVFTVGKNNEGSVPLAGATVSAGEESATTNANGRAKLTGSFADSVEVAVEKGGYLRQTKNISASGGKGSAVFTLQPEPDEDSVTVTVMGQDPKGGSPAPIVGALVSANGLTATTNKSGQATITGNFRNGIELEAKAKGFLSQVQQVTIAMPARTGWANFTLVHEPDPLRLIVEVLDSVKPNNPLAGATVYIHDPGKPVSRTSALAFGTTNNQGEVSLELRGSADDLARIHSGLKLEVVKDKYVVKLTDITKDSLLPSVEPRRVTVFLNSDWADLRAAVDALEPRVLAWNNDLALAGQASNLVQKLVEQSIQAREKVAKLLNEIESASVIASSGGMGPLPADYYCAQAARLRSNIQGYKAEAEAKEQALKTQLNNASALSASCSSAKDVAGVRGMYRSAIQLAGAIGALEKKAANDSDLLTKLASQRKDVKRLIEEVEKNIAEVRQEATKAETAATTAGAYFVRADNLNKTLYARHGALSGELVSLKARYGLDNFVEGLPTDLDKRVQLMTQLLGKQNNSVFGGPNVDWPKQVQDVSVQIQADKGRAEKWGARNNRLVGDCEIEAVADLVQEIGNATVSATTEVAAASDLANKCSESAKRGECAPVVGEVRNLMQQGAIEAAQVKVSEARAGGCDVTGLNEEIDYYKTLYEAVALLKGAQNNCRFQEALDFAHRMPAGVQEKPLMRQALADVQIGLNALMETRNLLERARQAGVAQNIAEQDRFLAAAQSRAQPYACLTEEVNNFKRDKRITRGRVLGAPVNKPEVEEIPDEALKNASEAGDILAESRKRFDKPEVEEIPEDAVKNTPKTGNAQPPEVEEIPEEAVKKPTSTSEVEEIPEEAVKKPTSTPEVEEIPAEAVRPNRAKTEERPGSVIGTAQQPSTQRQAAGERWIQDPVTVNHEASDISGTTHKWTYTAQSSSAHLGYTNGDQADFKWTPPPQQIDSNGFTVSLTVQTKPAPTSRMGMDMGVWGVVGLSTNSRGKDLAAYASGEVGEAKTATQE